MRTIRSGSRVGVAAAFLASLCVTVLAPAALASSSVVSAGSVPAGGTSAGTASFTLTENAVSAFSGSGGTLIVTLADSASSATVHFAGTPVLTAPGSLGASVTLGSLGTSFTITALGADPLHVEQITVSGLRISADAGAALGAIRATLTGTLAGAVTGGTTTATGTLQSAVSAASTTIVVNVTSGCGFAPTGGLNGPVNFSDISDPRSASAASALSLGQQTLTVNAGVAAHPAATTITQTIADCFGTSLGSPGTVGGGATGNHLVFTTQPGGGTAGLAWSQQPVVAVANTLNQVVTTDNTTFVTLSIGTNAAGGALTCVSGTTRQVVNGSASFAGCSINVASANAYTLIATASSGAAAATSSAFLVSSVGNHLLFTTQPGGGTAGVAWSQQPVVAVVNALNQVATTDNTSIVTLSIGLNPANGTLACSGGTSRRVLNGIAGFSGCTINAASANAYTLVASASGGSTVVTSSAFLISGGGVPITVTMSSATAVGDTRTGFSTDTKVVSVGATITLRIATNPSLAGQRLGIWISRKTNGVWSAFSAHASVTVGPGGVAYYVYSAGSTVWQSFQARYGGSATLAPGVAPARQARWM